MSVSFSGRKSRHRHNYCNRNQSRRESGRPSRFQDGVVARRQGFAVLWKFEAQMRPAYLVEAIYVQSGEFDR